MRKITTAAVLVAALTLPAVAQHQATGGGGAAVDLSVLPEGCRDALKGMDMSAMARDMDMSKMMDGKSGMRMDAAQKASMQAMMHMNGPMMATHMIEDPDLAFNCGMIAHHGGAIAMAEIVIAHGKDDETKALARRIIEDQKAEIRTMSDWVQANTKKK